MENTQLHFVYKRTAHTFFVQPPSLMYLSLIMLLRLSVYRPNFRKGAIVMLMKLKPAGI